jgi:glycosyltransferase involved in cell wall biosynthesis
MKIALVTAYFYPISSGGTEKYVLNLAKNLISDQNEVHIITTGYNEASEYDGIKIYQIPDELSNDPELLSGVKASTNLDAFRKLLDQNQYNLIHFHTLTPVFNIFHIVAAKNLNLEIHFTAHVPSVTCIHDDLIQFGIKACDGLIKKHRCTACYISKKGFHKGLSQIIATAVNTLDYPTSIAKIVERKKQNLELLNELCDKIFLFTNWQKEIFLMNGFNYEKIIITSQLLNKKKSPQTNIKKKIQNIGFVGRISHEKGLHVLIQAFNNIRRKDLQLHIAGVINGQEYFEKLKNSTAKNLNIHWRTNLSAIQIDAFYQEIDLLIIPSITYETGPFVLFEALENNIPVLANNLGDMELWNNKGFDVKTYNTTTDLKKILSKI